MRRRSLTLALPLGLVVLAGCDPAAPAGGSKSPPHVDVDPAPTVLGELATAVDVASLRLPLEMTPMIVVDPGWTATPLERDGIFLGYSDAGDRLRFRAVDQDGTVLWEAQRPLSCTGYSLSADADGRAVAVLADSSVRDDGTFATSVTGYDLRTAEELWGPVDVPGPQAAQGLVYTAPEDSPMGSSQPRTALVAGTGEVAVTEDELGDGRILAEHGGSIVRTDGAELVVASAATGEERWRTDLPRGVDAARAGIGPRIDPNTGYAVLAGGNDGGTVLDLADGAVIAEGADHVARDDVLDVTVLAAGKTLWGVEADGTEAWRHEDPEQLRFITAGERLAYALRDEEGTLVVIDTSQGKMVQPYDVDQEGPLGVPERFSADTAAAVDVSGTRYLVTTRFDEDFGTR
ncbi:outer membrane protein assembly factor BamB family protein [Brachybacterium alimentarium]|uniref:outer membrane protein assembly factor BamB family protein n=1 Tax=Brachybacterium alimentarium TaxID=47845 RepID=UPI003FD37831